MARIPTMSREECEAQLGPRGSLNVTVENRVTVRKWLVARGVPSAYASTLTLADLAACYNTEATFQDHAANAGKTVPEEARPAEQETIPEESFKTAGGASAAAKTVSNVAASVTAQGVDAKALAALQAIQSLMGANVDESKVAERVDAIMAKTLPGLVSEKTGEAIAANIPAIVEKLREIVPDLIPTIKIEIKSGDKITPKGPGLFHKQFPELLNIIAQGVPAMLVGPAGSGKTMAAEQAAESMGLSFYMQGGTSGSHELLGYCDAHGRYQTTPFRYAFEHGGVFLKDEIDVDDPAAILVINSALANGAMAFPDTPNPVRRHKDFYFIGAANTFGQGADRLYVGRNQLDAATLDRFAFLSWRYDEKLERAVAGNDSWVDRVQSLRRGAEKEKARVVISPRASINGAKLLAAGMTRDAVEQALIWKGTDGDLRSRIERAAA